MLEWFRQQNTRTLKCICVIHRAILYVRLTLDSYSQLSGDTVNTVYVRNSCLENTAYKNAGKNVPVNTR